MALGAFFALGAAVCAASAASLIWPRGAVAAMWRFKPSEFEQLLRLGPLAPTGFIALTILMCAASVGTFARKGWGWWLSVAIFAANGVGDALRIPLGSPLEGAFAVAVAAVVLWWLSRPRVRALFGRGGLDAVTVANAD